MQHRTNGGLKHTVWVALLALLVQVLSPALIHAGQPQTIVLSEICTAFGIKKVAHKTSDLPDSKHPGEHCALCVISDSWAPPASLPVSHPVSPIVFAVPHFADSQQYARTRASLHLRGPPDRA